MHGPRAQSGRVVAAALAALVAGIGVLWWFVAGIGTPEQSPEKSIAAPAEAFSRPVVDIAAREAVPEATPIPASVLPPAEAASSTPRGAWRGRLLAPDGTPAAGVPWTMGIWLGPGDAEGSSGVTDADGRFEASFDVVDDGGVHLRFDPADAVPIMFSDQTPFAALQLDLGDIQLEAGATLRGSIVDVEGRGVPGDWEVFINDTLGDIEQRPRRWACPRDRVDAAAGRFTSSGVPAGTRDVRAQLRVAVPGSGEQVTYRTVPQQLAFAAGETREAVLVLAGPVLSRQLVVVVRGVDDRPCSDVDPVDVVLSGPDGPRPAPRRLDHVGESQLLQFCDVPPGSYSLEIRDAAHRPWRRTGVRPGLEPLLAELEGSCTLDLQVVDEADGSSVETFGVSASIPRRRKVNFAGTESVFCSSSDPGLRDGIGQVGPHAGGLLSIDRLPVDALSITVSAPGFEDGDADWPGTSADGRDALRVALRRVSTAAVAGRVVEADGSPAAGVMVALFDGDGGELTGRFVSGAEYWTLDLSPPGFETSREMLAGNEPAITDADGRFHIETKRLVRCHVRAWRSSVVDAWALVEPSKGPLPDFELSLPATACLSGRLVVKDSPPGGSWGVALMPADAGQAARVLPPATSTDHAGQFRFKALTPGAWHVFVRPSGGWQPLALALPSGGARGPAFYDLVQQQQIPCSYLGRVDVLSSGGETVFDVDDIQPGSLRVRTLRGTEPLADVEVDVWQRRGAPDEAWIDNAVSGTDGWTNIEPLAPGVYTVEVSVSSARSVPADTRRIDVLPGAALEWTVVVDLRRATLLCLDADSHAPLARCPVRVWWRDGDEHGHQWLRTDGDGRIALELPPGELRVARLDETSAGLLGDDTDGGFDALAHIHRMRLLQNESADQAWKQDVPVTWGLEGRDVPVLLPPAKP